MKINNIKINGFGKLIDKEFNFINGINLITGDNESGKSTFAKCIQSLFFGVSRNKNGKLISDYEKFKPWNDIPFSAKIKYSLDNGEQFEVFRDFSKRNTRIFNDNLEDISANFSIDKNKNSYFFTEQTNISEDIFVRTAVVSQQESKLSKIDQNIIMQKVSNLVSTGDDTVSFKKILDRLNRKQLDEVGTQRSSERPINIVLNKIDECNSKIKDIDSIKSQNIEMNNKLIELKADLKKLENEIILIKELLNIKNNEKITLSQIDSLKKIISEFDDKIEAIDKEIEIIKLKNSSKLKFAIGSGLLCIIFTILIFILKLPIATIIISGILLLLSIFMIFKRVPVSDSKTILVNSKSEKQNELNDLVKKYENVRLSTNDFIRNKYGQTSFLNMNYDELTSKLEEDEKNYSNLMLSFNTLSINSQNTQKHADELAQIEEDLCELNEELNVLNFLNDSINIAKDALNEAYIEMKNNITPEFTNCLSNTIAKISDNKYNQVKFSDENGLIVELDNGNYINTELLSIGTIDQMYISLRLAALKNVSTESLPIILDEAFVYFDNNRLKNMLDILNNEFYQIFIFSCSNREKDLLNSMNIRFNEIKM